MFIFLTILGDWEDPNGGPATTETPDEQTTESGGEFLCISGKKVKHFNEGINYRIFNC